MLKLLLNISQLRLKFFRDDIQHNIKLNIRHKINNADVPGKDVSFVIFRKNYFKYLTLKLILRTMITSADIPDVSIENFRKNILNT